VVFGDISHLPLGLKRFCLVFVVFCVQAQSAFIGSLWNLCESHRNPVGRMNLVLICVASIQIICRLYENLEVQVPVFILLRKNRIIKAYCFSQKCNLWVSSL